MHINSISEGEDDNSNAKKFRYENEDNYSVGENDEDL